MKSGLVLLLALLCCSSPGLRAQVVLSEFLANNTHTLADDYGEFSDWIELHNTGPNAVSLEGWRLTDEAADLAKWRFPATNLLADAYLVVFASGRDRRTPGAPLHTNFKLSTGGEYLALVEPDGVTVASQYAPAFPPQVAGVSFGLNTGWRRQILLPTNALARYLVPANDALGTNWLLPAYNDSGWLTATAGVGYTVAAAGDFPGLTNTLAGYWKFDETAGLRVADASRRGNAGTLTGFSTNNAQWVPGRAGGALALLGAPANQYVSVPNYPKATNALSVAAWVWAEGRPVWASIAKNWGSSRSGQFHFGLRDTAGDLDLFLTTTNGQVNVREGAPFPLGAWQHVAFVADGSAVALYRNGAQVASAACTGRLSSSVNALGIGVKLNDAGAAPDTGAPGFWQGIIDDLAVWNRALSTAEVQALANAGGAYSQSIRTDLRKSLFQNNASCYLRFPFVVDNPQLLTRWLLQVQYDDGFVAWLNGQEIARRNAPEPLAWDSRATNASVEAAAPAFEDFQLSAFENLIVPGTNVLAFQGLNVAPDDNDFLIWPVLTAASVAEVTNAQVYFTLPTPGALNLMGVEELGPILSQANHTPALPADAEALVVTVRVVPAFHAVTNVTLHYRIMFSNAVTTPMLDDGAHGDRSAGDGIYGAAIPASASTRGQMIRYFITAGDSAGRGARLPLFDDRLNSEEFYGAVVRDPSITTPLPVFQWFVASPSLADTDAGTRCSLFYQGEFYDNLFVRIRGGTARSWPKKSYKIECNDDHHFLLHPDLPRVNEFDLNATYTDKSFVRSVLTYEHQRDAGLPSPESFLVHLRQNAQFYSVAIFLEQPDRDFLRRHELDPEGALYKGGPGSTFDSISSFEKKTRKLEGTADLQALITGLGLSGAALEKFVFDNLDLPGQVNFMATVAITQNIDASDKNHFLYRDTLGTGEWRMLPWDLDLTFGPNALNTDTMVYNQQDTGAPACASHPFIGARPYLLHGGKYNRLLEAIVNTPRARQMLLCRLRTLSDEYLLSGYFQRRIDQLVPLISADVLLDKTRWGANAHFSGATYTLQQAIDRIEKEYLAPRVSYLLGTNIAGVGAANPARQPVVPAIDFGPMEVNPAGGQAQEYLCLTNPNAFALDLSGWKMSSQIEFAFKPGAVLPSNSVLYLSPDVAAFRARTAGPRGGQGLFVQGNYRGLLSARGGALRLCDSSGREIRSWTYAGAPSLAQQYLRITEIMYHPAPLAGDAYDAEQFEYLELKNIGPVALALAGVHFTNGLVFDFSNGAVASLAPGQRVLVARNLAAFAARYGAASNLAGQFTGALENRGETLRLDDATGEKILEFAYDNQWYPITDGHGFSLVTVDENAPWDTWGLRESWRPSGALHGSPGAVDPMPPALAPIVINEALSRSEAPPPTDSIELYNPTPNAVNLGGWFLTDDFDTPQKYRLPDDTVIPANGYLVFTEAQFNPTPGVPPSFALNSDGDEVYLFSADAAGRLTGYLHGYSFGAAADGVSFGRYLTSTDEEHFVAQRERTLGGPNAGPLVGPVVIGEIMYHPPALTDGSGPAWQLAAGDEPDLEFIELQNNSSQPVPLYDPAFPTNTWRVRGAVSFDFPTNLVLAPGAPLVLVSFEPNTNAAARAAFLARYHVPTNIFLTGPYTGKLGNAAESVKLLRPEAPVATPGPDLGRVPYLLVEQVDYRQDLPWPALADGYGTSLQRRDPAGYGNDPAHWAAAAPNPGAGFAGGTPPTIPSELSDLNAVADTDVALRVEAAGTAPLWYEWRWNGLAIAGATNSVLRLTNVQSAQAGLYQAVVLNGAGAATSRVARLSVSLPAFITQQPQSRNALLGSTATLSVSAVGSGPLRYQWQFDGADLPGATNASLTLTNLQTDDAGTYTVAIMDGVGSVTSQPALLQVLIKAAIVVQPQSQTVVQGGTVSLSIVATGTPPLSYRWRRNGVTLSGQTNAVLTFINVQTNRAGTYTCLVTNLGGSAPTSSNAVLTVLADADGDHLPDAWEKQFGLDPNTNADRDLDPDGDGLRTWQEYEAGTDPTNALSYLKVENLALGAGQPALKFLALSNRTYSVLCQDTLAVTTWSKLADVPAQPTNRLETVIDPLLRTNRFYRLVTPALP